MTGKIPFALAATICVGALLCPALGQQPAKRTRAKKQTQPAAAQPAPPPAPLQPLTLDQMPAVPPQVSYQGGQLVVIAQNSTLGDILRAIRKQTGASVDVPGNATERVVGRFGPGSARDVIASLLNGSHFNYVVLGSATDPNVISQVILTPRTGGVSPPSNPGNPGIAQTVYPGQVNPAVAQAQAEAASENPEQPDANGDTQGMEVVEDNANQEQQEQQQADNPQEGAPQGQVKTPEQLLQELQQQQQQQQLIQQQQQQQQGGQPTQPGVYPGGPPVPRPPEPH